MSKIARQTGCVVMALCCILPLFTGQAGAAENLYPHDVVGHAVTTIWFDKPPENVLNRYFSYGREKPAAIPAPPYIVFEYFEIDVKEVSFARVEFRVDKKWLTLHNIRENGVRLLKFTGNWIEIPVIFENVVEGYAYYSSDLFSFSTFAIVASPEEKSRGEIHFAILIAGLFAAGLIYWFLVRPRRLFVSMRRLKKSIKKTEEPPPPEEISLKIAHLKKKTEELYRTKEKKERHE
ncbi:MAG: PGF-pre-PGF domain-containing protein [Candidatus Hadarchaeales archaeon]